MPENEIYSRFAYFDTNILSIIAKDSTRWRVLQDFLYRDKLCLAISGAQVAELSSDTRLHKPLNDFLTAVPSLMKSSTKKSTHTRRDVRRVCLPIPLNALYGKQDFARYLSSAELVQARGEQRQTARIWMQHLSELKSNFPESKSGKYTAPSFRFCMDVEYSTTFRKPPPLFGANVVCGRRQRLCFGSISPKFVESGCAVPFVGSRHGFCLCRVPTPQK